MPVNHIECSAASVRGDVHRSPVSVSVSDLATEAATTLTSTLDASGSKSAIWGGPSMVDVGGVDDLSHGSEPAGFSVGKGDPASTMSIQQQWQYLQQQQYHLQLQQLHTLQQQGMLPPSVQSSNSPQSSPPQHIFSGALLSQQIRNRDSVPSATATTAAIPSHSGTVSPAMIGMLNSPTLFSGSLTATLLAHDAQAPISVLSSTVSANSHSSSLSFSNCSAASFTMPSSTPTASASSYLDIFNSPTLIRRAAHSSATPVIVSRYDQTALHQPYCASSKSQAKNAPSQNTDALLRSSPISGSFGSSFPGPGFHSPSGCMWPPPSLPQDTHMLVQVRCLNTSVLFGFLLLPFQSTVKSAQCLKCNEWHLCVCVCVCVCV
jgi:hypothetical protein